MCIHIKYGGGKELEGGWFLLPVPGGRPSLSRHKTTSFPGPQRASGDANDPGAERGDGGTKAYFPFFYTLRGTRNAA
jgi:hypothetical protein